MDRSTPVGPRRLAIAAALTLLAVVGTLAVPGVALAQEEITDGGTYWRGQELVYADGVSPGDVVRVVRDDDGTVVFELDANDDGEVRIEPGLSAELQAGEYRLERQDGTVLVRFRLRSVEIGVSAEPTQVRNAGSETQLDLHIEANRGATTVVVQSPDLGRDRITEIFGNNEVELDGDGTATVTGDFTGVPSNIYEIRVEEASGVASDSVEVDVLQGSDGSRATGTSNDAEAEQRAEQEAAEDGEADQRGDAEATTPQRGFLTNGEGGPLSNVLNLTFLGFLLSAFGIFYQLMEGR